MLSAQHGAYPALPTLVFDSRGRHGMVMVHRLNQARNWSAAEESLRLYVYWGLVDLAHDPVHVSARVCIRCSHGLLLFLVPGHT